MKLRFQYINEDIVVTFDEMDGSRMTRWVLTSLTENVLYKWIDRARHGQLENLDCIEVENGACKEVV